VPSSPVLGSPVPASPSKFPVLSPLQKFKLAGKRMKDIQRMRAVAGESHFAAVFDSDPRESINKGGPTMNEKDKETVDKLLKDLQEYERKLEEERDQISEERDMMQLQQEAVEHLLETETMKSQELEARILELEEIVESQMQQQETEELMMKIEMLESEIERQQESMAKMAAEQQEGLKRGTSSKSARSSPWNEDREESESSSEEGSDPGGAVNRDSVVSISAIGNAKIQGELLQLRSSMAHKNKAIEEQAKELAKLREQLGNSEEVQKMHHLEATCEDFRNESKQFRSELDQLKAYVAEMEAARQEDAEKMEAMKQAELETKEALQKAEEERDEANRKLEVTDLLNLGKTLKKQTPLEDVLAIDGGKSASDKAPVEKQKSVEVEEEREWRPRGAPAAAEEPKKEEAQTGWFGFGGDEKKDTKAPELEPEKKKEDEGFNWFGLGGKKEDKEETDDDGEEETDGVGELPSMQVPAASSGGPKEKRLSNMLDF